MLVYHWATERHQYHTHSAVCVEIEWEMCSNHSLTHFERRDVIGHRSWCLPIFHLDCDLWNSKLVVKLVSYTILNERRYLNLAVEGSPSVLFNWIVVTWIHTDHTVQSKDCLGCICWCSWWWLMPCHWLRNAWPPKKTNSFFWRRHTWRRDGGRESRGRRWCWRRRKREE